MERKTVFWIKTAVYTVLALVGLTVGILHALSLGVGYHDEFVDTVHIESEEDLRAMGGSFYNNICHLEADITVSSLSALASKAHPFIGSFDGHGHTVTLKGAAATASFFGYIGEGGSVRNLHIVVEESHLSSRGIAAALAIENAGSIENCRITVKSCYVEARGSYAAVGINRGSMSFVAAEISFIGAMPADEQISSAALTLASHAAYNYGSIRSALSSVSYTDIAEADGDKVADPSSGTVNRGVGAAVGNNGAGGTLTDCSAYIGEGTHLTDVHASAYVIASTDRRTVYSIDNIFYTLGYREDIWELRGEELVFLQGV